MSWLLFEQCGQSKSGKTLIWRVLPKDSGDPSARLGHISWYAPWRKYTFSPVANTVFEQDCLRDIASFCERQTKIHKDTAQRWDVPECDVRLKPVQVVGVEMDGA